MKKLLSTVLALLMLSGCVTGLCLSAKDTTGGKENTNSIPRAKIKPVIDGIIDNGEWRGAYKMNLNDDTAGFIHTALKAGQVAMPHASAKLSVLWYADEANDPGDDPDFYFASDGFETDGIYILAEVTDCTKAYTVGDELGTKATPAANATDGVEVIFDALDSDTELRQAGTYCYAFQPYTCIAGGNGTVPGGSATFWEYWSFGYGEEGFDDSELGVDVASVTHFKGYTDDEVAEMRAAENWAKEGSDYVKVVDKSEITGYTMEMFIPFYVLSNGNDDDPMTLNPFIENATTGLSFVLVDYLYSGNAQTSNIESHQGINAAITDISAGNDAVWPDLLDMPRFYTTYSFGGYVTEPQYEKGDVDLSGDRPTISDALLLFKHVAGVELITNADALLVADVDDTAGISISDALTLFKYVAGIISEL